MMLFFGFIAFIIILAISGGAYLYLEKQEKDRKKKLQKQIDQLQEGLGSESGESSELSESNGSNGSNGSNEEAAKTPPSPVDCVMSEWEEWDQCSADCGGGTQYRSRAITTQPAYGGESCGEEEESRECNSQVCDVDCVVGWNGVPDAWSPFSACTKSCGTGQKTRTREIITYPDGNGARCGSLSDTQSCNTQACAKDCIPGNWENKGCLTLNGNRRYWEYRPILSPAVGSGKCFCQWRITGLMPNPYVDCPDKNVSSSLIC